MIVHGIWFAVTAIAVYSSYRMGYRSGFRTGNKEGFVTGLKRSIAVQKPTEVLCRTLVPRPIADYGRYFASLIH